MVLRFNKEPVFYGAALPRHKKLVPNSNIDLLECNLLGLCHLSKLKPNKRIAALRAAILLLGFKNYRTFKISFKALGV
jgi:hypothetical protein